MLSKALAFSVLVAFAQARFGQEQVPIGAISAVQGGGPGVAATIAGRAVSDLLAAANPCHKLQTGDKILAQLGTGADAIAAAKGFVAAEQNFNPFVTSIPNICSDPSLPTNPILRGITPLIDPAVLNSAFVIALSKKSLTQPFDATGKSVADVLRAQGFANFTAVALDGTKVAPNFSGAASSVADNSAVVASSASTEAASSTVAAASTVADSTITSSASVSSATGAIDYGLCNPQLDFVGGRPNRKPTEFTFLPIDPLCSKGQEEALNINIITNRICDQLTNVCQSNAAAKAQCQSCKAKILALGTRNQITADAWNECVIAGTNIAQDTTSGVVSGTAATTITGAQAAATAVSYGLCDPQMDFVAGRPGRKATEFTFLPIDPLTKQGQEEALNPNIITNRICDQLTNVCNANAIAKAQCQACKAQISALGTRNQGTADAWNECVIKGTNIKQDTAGSSASDVAVNTTDAASTVATSGVMSSIDASTTEDSASATDVGTEAPSATSSDDSSVVTVTNEVTVTSVSTTTVAGDCTTAGSVAESTSANLLVSPVTTDSVSNDAPVTVTVTSVSVSMSVLTMTVSADCTATAVSSSSPAATVVSNNVQAFTGSLGSPPVPVQNVGGARPFVVNGSSFVNFAAACQRSCDVQHNRCANAANAKTDANLTSVSQCDTQDTACGTLCKQGPATASSATTPAGAGARKAKRVVVW